jgi:8-oxo-dGTP pyrophosphatase MutT (NUDIX family)
MGYVEEIRALVGHRPLILVGAIVIVVDEQGRLLLQQRKHPAGSWAIPGGLMELGESVQETARRELYEETTLAADNLQLINVYSGPDNYIIAPNGDEFYTVTSAFYSQDVTGVLTVDKEESLDFGYFSPHQLPEPIVKSHRVILKEFLDKIYPNLI